MGIEGGKGEVGGLVGGRVLSSVSESVSIMMCFRFRLAWVTCVGWSGSVMVEWGGQSGPQARSYCIYN